MKNQFLILCICYCLSFPSLGQKRLYLPDNSFKFELAKFKMPLFGKQEIVGMFKDLLLIQTTIDNTNTTLLVDKEGNIIEKFDGDWYIPQN